MQSAIQFLEFAGSKVLTAAEYAAVVSALDVESAEREALTNRDHVSLNDLLGGREKMYCMVVTPHKETPDMPDEDVPAEDVPEEDAPAE